MNKYKVSIIIPCYNIGYKSNNNYFDNMFDSLLNQTIGFEDLEIVLIDDCSADNTRDILLNLNEKYDNVKIVLSDVNRGAGETRNAGLDASSADYIIFLDSDDMMEEHSIETMYNEIISNDVDFVKTNYYIVTDEIRKYHSFHDGKIFVNPQKGDMSKITNGFVWGVIYDKSFLINNNIRFKKTFADDSLFTSECFNKTEKDILFLENCYSVYYICENMDSVTHSVSYEDLIECINVHTKIMEDTVKRQSTVSIKYNKMIIWKLLIGFYVTINEDTAHKKILCKKLKELFLKYEKISIEWELYWRIHYDLIMNEQIFLLNISSKIIKTFFDNPLFKKLFRYKNYD